MSSTWKAQVLACLFEETSRQTEKYMAPRQIKGAEPL